MVDDTYRDQVFLYQGFFLLQAKSFKISTALDYCHNYSLEITTQGGLGLQNIFNQSVMFVDLSPLHILIKVMKVVTLSQIVYISRLVYDKIVVLFPQYAKGSGGITIARTLLEERLGHKT